MKIAVFLPRTKFTSSQQERLAKLGEVNYVDDWAELPLEKLLKFTEGADIIVPDPDPFGGFEKAPPLLMAVIKSLSSLKGICLSTTSFGWIDLDYCKEKKLPVSNVPDYSREAVAEHALGLLFCLAKKIIVFDRRTQKGEFKTELSSELKGKTLGIIGLGNIGSRIAEMALGIGMKVVAYNRSPKQQTGVQMKSFEEVLQESDMLSLHVTHEPANRNLINQEKISKMKPGVLIVNLVDRDLVDEPAMAEALKSGQVGAYAWEGRDLTNTPLAGLENSVGLKPFAWYTKESLENLFQILTDNIVALAENRPQNRVV